MAGVQMARTRKNGPKQPRTWAERKGKFQSIAVYRDVAKMAAKVAKDEGISVAELTEPLLRSPLERKYRAILERELRSMGGAES